MLLHGLYCAVNMSRPSNNRKLVGAPSGAWVGADAVCVRRANIRMEWIFVEIMIRTMNSALPSLTAAAAAAAAADQYSV